MWQTHKPQARFSVLCHAVVLQETQKDSTCVRHTVCGHFVSTVKYSDPFSFCTFYCFLHTIQTKKSENISFLILQMNKLNEHFFLVGVFFFFLVSTGLFWITVLQQSSMTFKQEKLTVTWYRSSAWARAPLIIHPWLQPHAAQLNSTKRADIQKNNLQTIYDTKSSTLLKIFANIY